MAAAAASTALSMKLLIDTNTQRVLSAEAGKDVVDFLFSLLTLPVGTAVKLLRKDSMVGCVGNLYVSVERLDNTYVQADAAKDALLSPVVLSPAASSNTSVLRLPSPPSGQPKSFFRCGYGSMTDVSGTKCTSCRNPMTMACPYVAPAPDQKTQNAAAFEQGVETYTLYGACDQAVAAKEYSLFSSVMLSPAASSTTSILRLPAPSSAQSNKSYISSSVCRSNVTDTSGTKCPNCQHQMTTACSYVAGGLDKNTQNAAADGAKGGGFVRGIVTYTVMDDLTVALMSSISSITLLNTFAVKDLCTLQEKVVQLGYTEGREILKASLQSKTVLTDVFLGKKKTRQA